MKTIVFVSTAIAPQAYDRDTSDEKLCRTPRTLLYLNLPEIQQNSTPPTRRGLRRCREVG